MESLRWINLLFSTLETSDHNNDINMKVFKSIASRLLSKPPPGASSAVTNKFVSPHGHGLNLDLQTENNDDQLKFDQEIESAFDQLSELANNVTTSSEATTSTINNIKMSQDEIEDKIHSILTKNGENVPQLISIAGKLFEAKEDPTNDKVVAANLFKTIVEKFNDPTAAYSYGMCLQQGQGVSSPDEKMAVKMFARAARRGHPWAQ